MIKERWETCRYTHSAFYAPFSRYSTLKQNCIKSLPRLSNSNAAPVVERVSTPAFKASEPLRMAATSAGMDLQKRQHVNPSSTSLFHGGGGGGGRGHKKLINW